MIEKIVKNTPVILLYGILFILSAILFSMNSKAATYQENRNWDFQDPISKAVKLQKLQTELLLKGGYYKGSHANRTYTGAVTVNNATFGNYQNSVNIKNWIDSTITGDSNMLNVDQGGDGDQSSQNANTDGGDVLLNGGN